jgi:hypothetical protein
MKANQVGITSNRNTEAWVEDKPDPKKMRDFTSKEGFQKWCAYENDKAAKRMIEREHCKRNDKQQGQPWPYNMPVEARCYNGGFDRELSQCDFKSKNGPRRKCKRKGYYKNLAKKQTGKRNANNRQYLFEDHWTVNDDNNGEYGAWKKGGRIYYGCDDDDVIEFKPLTKWERQRMNVQDVLCRSYERKAFSKKNQKRKNRRYAKRIASGKL